MKTAFYVDMAALGRPWSFFEEQALSGTDSMFLAVARELIAEDRAILFVNALPKERTAPGVYKVGDALAGLALAKELGATKMVINVETLTQQAALFRDKVSSIQLIAWAHCTPSFEWMSAAYKAQSFQSLIAVSHTQAASLSYHPIYSKTKVIPNFVDGDLPISHDDNADTNFVTFVGALRPEKGFQHLAAAWRRVRHSQPKLRLRVCGSPGLYSSLHQLGPHGIAEAEFERAFLASLGGSRESALDLGVEFLGSVGKRELRQIMQASLSVIVNLNTRGSLETFCLSAVEALVVGTPVIGGRAGSLPEVVGHNRGGILVASQSELVEAILQLDRDWQLRSKLARQGREHARRYYSKEVAMRKWREIDSIPSGSTTEQRLLSLPIWKTGLSSMTRRLPLGTLTVLRSTWRAVLRR